MHSASNMQGTAWYLLQAKPGQEFIALAQLESQGYTCFLPTLQVDRRLDGGKLTTWTEPLFARYLFIQLDTMTSNWSSIRSTRGVNKIVAFDNRFPTLSEDCISALRRASIGLTKSPFEMHELADIKNVRLTEIEGIVQVKTAEDRAMALIELMSQPQQLSINLEALRKVA